MRGGRETLSNFSIRMFGSVGGYLLIDVGGVDVRNEVGLLSVFR